MGNLSEAHRKAWVAFFVSHGRLSRKIDARMAGAGVVGLDVYDVLISLEMAPQHRLRMCELAEAVVLSRSGLTRMVDRLERSGMVRREGCPGDRRSLYAVLTTHGAQERERAWPTLERAIGELFASTMTEAEASVVAEIFGRTVPEIESACPKSACGTGKAE